MNTKHASIKSIGAAPWKFLLLAATLLFSYALPVHADDHEEATAAATEEAVEEEAGPLDDYNGLLEHQGEGAAAFDFFTTSMLLFFLCKAFTFLFSKTSW